MWRSLCLFIISATILDPFAQARTPNSAPPPSKEISDFTEYVNSFSSFDELLTYDVQVGFMNAADRIEVESILEKHGVALKMRPTPSRFRGNTHLWGSVGWSRHSDRKYRTLDGVTVEVLKSDTSADLFRKMFAALSKEYDLSFFDLFMSRAEAQTSYADKASSAGAFVADAIFGTVGFGLGWVANQAVYQTRKLTTQWKVTCGIGEYSIVTNIDYHTMKAELNFPGNISDCLKVSPSGEVSTYRGPSEKLCTYATAAAFYLKHAFQFSDRDNRMWVKDSTVAKIFNGKSRSCNTDNALIVQKALQKMSENPSLFSDNISDALPPLEELEKRSVK